MFWYDPWDQLVFRELIQGQAIQCTSSNTNSSFKCVFNKILQSDLRASEDNLTKF